VTHSSWDSAHVVAPLPAALPALQMDKLILHWISHRVCWKAGGGAGCSAVGVAAWVSTATI
jgi:hypothetical protein